MTDSSRVNPDNVSLPAHSKIIIYVAVGPLARIGPDIHGISVRTASHGSAPKVPYPKYKPALNSIALGAYIYGFTLFLPKC